jgi:hypothetical protein
MNCRKRGTILIFILMLLMTLPVSVPAEESGAFQQEPVGEDNEIVGMLELIELMELLKDMEMLTALEEEK